MFQQGDWTVVESTLPQVPPDSVDEPPPTPHPTTLRKRTLETMALMKKTAGDDVALSRIHRAWQSRMELPATVVVADALARLPSNPRGARR